LVPAFDSFEFFKRSLYWRRRITAMNRPERKLPITGLDVIRFFAAFLVMAHHLAFWSWAVAYEATANSITNGSSRTMTARTRRRNLWGNVAGKPAQRLSAPSEEQR
jgi:hypothetical protein